MAPGHQAGLLKAGNVNLFTRPNVRNPDGSHSTVRTITITDDKGRAFLIPTVVGNRVLPDRLAILHFKMTGQHLGQFINETAADRYAQKLHLQQQSYYENMGADPRTLARALK